MVLTSTKSWPLVTQDNDLEMLAGVGMSVAMGNGSSSVKEKLLNTLPPAINKTESTRPWNTFGVLASEKVFVSRDYQFSIRSRPSTI